MQGTIHQLAESAGSPFDFVSVAGSVNVPQNLISGRVFNLIDLLSHYEVVWAAEAN
jgi:hypothetical protein